MRYEASGANGTPLGTPARMSPVATPVNAPSPSSKDVKPVATTATGNGEVKEKDGEKKDKKDKKRKAEAVEEAKVCDRHADSCSLPYLLTPGARH